MINYRVANKSDAINIAGLHARNWKLYYRSALREEYLKNEVDAERLAAWTKRLLVPGPNQQIIIAEENQTLVGFACTFLNDDPFWGAYLDNLHVAPEYKGKGIGYELMYRSAGIVLNKNANAKLYLWVLVDNIPAIKFYEKLGGERAELKEQTMPDGSKVETYRYAWKHVEALINNR
ncbi:MAG: GNAT family N-acetyltransferase [Bacteroidota bacterium]